MGDPVAMACFPVVSEDEWGPAPNRVPTLAQDSQIGIERDLAESHHDPDLMKQIEFPFEIRAATTKFVGCRLVVGRSTPNRSGNIRCR